MRDPILFVTALVWCGIGLWGGWLAHEGARLRTLMAWKRRLTESMEAQAELVFELSQMPRFRDLGPLEIVTQLIEANDLLLRHAKARPDVPVSMPRAQA